MIPAKGQNEGMADANFMKHIISENLHSPSGSSSQQFRELTKADKIKRKLRQPRFYIPLSLLFLIVIAISIAVPIVIRNNKKNPRDAATTTDPNDTSESTPDTEEPPTSSPTTSPATTTILYDGFRVILRSEWVDNEFDPSGKYKQLTPVKRVIILYIKTDDTCLQNGHYCNEFIAKHQQEAYSDFDDITENFIVGPDGNFYEGRGFNKEGQTTYGSLTSFNSKAISIGFMLKEADLKPSANQTDGFCQFIDKSLKNQDLDKDFLLYSHSELTSSSFTEFKETPFSENGVGCEFDITWGTRENLNQLGINIFFELSIFFLSCRNLQKEGLERN